MVKAPKGPKDNEAKQAHTSALQRKALMELITAKGGCADKVILHIPGLQK